MTVEELLARVKSHQEAGYLVISEHRLSALLRDAEHIGFLNAVEECKRELAKTDVQKTIELLDELVMRNY